MAKSQLHRFDGDSEVEFYSTGINEFGDFFTSGYVVVNSIYDLESRLNSISELASLSGRVNLFIVCFDGAIVPERVPLGMNLMVKTFHGEFVRIILDRQARRKRLQ